MEDIKKYKINRKLTEFNCRYCNKESSKPTSEYNRNIKLNRNNFCSRSCCVTYSNKNSHYINTEKRGSHLKSICGNRKDMYTPFRYLLRSARNRFHEFNLDLPYLKELWETQRGICPYSKIELILPEYKKQIKNTFQRASLDRIDSSIGYLKGNVQYVSTSINYLKGELSNNELISFLDLIAENRNVLNTFK